MEKLNLDFIQNRRLELDITLLELAKVLGFKNASTYMKYEKGNYTFKANHLPLIARVLDCKIEDLF
ncbi:XRE family transcriptional regulator [Bacillus toyonensis]|uniref:HTH cro/C1-type domain-containing protein n=1 Tax=Bacillus thuringiensis DB27 TaxID=1431339 RepID=W8YAW3_BACTU|nr:MULTISPECIES: helix-turn-helix transcriptional regulator [Bacillus]MBG9630938.1 DNA-binding protein [Bacillus thuringiensis]MBG9667072.1 DNA-binding protein [Bacillus thuringiensis]MBH0356075.1 DNA-binding protein [Bacillus thuringiensis]MBJ8058201.1 helix-turn-helix transcriptional regulator [Bacillus cereus]PEN34005.1 XRE family transcriptional regulator [Bacillus toyonensis]